MDQPPAPRPPRPQRWTLLKFCFVEIFWLALVFAVWLGLNWVVHFNCGPGFRGEPACVRRWMRPATGLAVIAAAAPIVAYAFAARADRRGS